MGRRSLVFKNLLVVEQKVSFAVEYVIDGRGHDLMVIAPVPTITVLSDVRGVVASLDCSNVVDYGKQRVSITAEGTVAVFSCNILKITFVTTMSFALLLLSYHT